MGSLPTLTRLPPGSWDTHVHVFDSSIGPFAADRAYTPAEAPLQDLLDFNRSLTQNNQLSNLVIVQPSPYSKDNAVLLAALGRLRHKHGISARGIAVVDLGCTSDAELWCLHILGIRGLRLNVAADGRSVSTGEFARSIAEAAKRIQHLPNWKLQLFCPGRVWDDIYDTILSLPVEVIADHIGGMFGPSKLDLAIQDPTKQKGFEPLVRLAEKSRVYIKISGLYRLSTRQDAGYSDLEPIIRALAQRVPDRLVYASDWPHTGEGSKRRERNLEKVEGFREIDNELVVDNLRRWIGESVWQKMMVTTPRRLYS
ncbi:hypothetical protein ACJ41O_010910 [Fusarium nematophilum]